MEKLYSLAPYFRVGFKDNVLICGFGSIQSKFKDENLQLIILKVLEYVKTPRTLKDIKSFLDKTSQNKNIKRTVFYYLTKKHWLLEDGVYVRDDRYSRNFLYYNLSGGHPTEVQTSLANKHVVILGCGGIGNIVGVGLATAGIGKLTLVDQDSIELSNLSRQFMFKELDVDMLKVDILKKELTSRNINIKIDTICHCIDEENLDILPKADLIVLSADSYNILKTITLHSIKNNVPIINVGYIEDIASWGPIFIPGKTGCFFCQSNSVDNTNITNKLQQYVSKINTQYQAPSNGPLNMLAASCALIDIIKFLGGFGKLMSVNQRLGIWTHNLKIQKQNCSKNINCNVCG